jgi:hypothetical protein
MRFHLIEPVRAKSSYRIVVFCIRRNWPDTDNGLIGKWQSEDDVSRLGCDGRSGVNKIVHKNCMLQAYAAPCYNPNGQL